MAWGAFTGQVTEQEVSMGHCGCIYSYEVAQFYKVVKSLIISRFAFVFLISNVKTLQTRITQSNVTQVIK